MQTSLHTHHQNYLPRLLLASLLLHVIWFSYYLPSLSTHNPFDNKNELKRLSSKISLRLFHPHKDTNNAQAMPKNEVIPTINSASQIQPNDIKKIIAPASTTQSTEHTIKGIKLVPHYIKPIHARKKHRDIWRNTPVASIEKTKIIPMHPIQDKIAEGINWEQQARTAQLIFVWEQWWQQAIQEKRFERIPERARCKAMENKWKCIFDDIPFNPISLNGEGITEAFNQFKNTLGGNTIKLSLNQDKKWHIEKE